VAIFDQGIDGIGRRSFRYLQAGVSHAMPPGNVTAMDDEERALIMRWYRELRAGSDNPLLASAGW
jgi:uncharacterized membrane protein